MAERMLECRTFDGSQGGLSDHPLNTLLEATVSDSSLRLFTSLHFQPFSSSTVYPSVIATHPSAPNQIAIGMSDGAVYVIEPSVAEPKCGSGQPPQDNATAPGRVLQILL